MIHCLMAKVVSDAVSPLYLAATPLANLKRKLTDTVAISVE